jgi:type II secretory pathway pseudopilin PulG
MAIIGILSAVILPSMISKIEEANSVGEDAKLEEIARALVAGIKAGGTIPNPNLTPYNANGGGWGDIAENYTTLTGDTVNPGTLHYVFAEVTQNDCARRVYLDDQFMTYLVAASGAGVNGVFQTPAAGWPEQAGGLYLANIPLRMYIVSSSKKDLSLSCQANQAGTGTVPSPQPAPGYGAGLIADLQNWVKTVQPENSPNAGSIMVPGSIAQWGTAAGTQYRRGEFLNVKVVDLRPLFCRVELTDFASPINAAVTVAGGGVTPYVSAAVVGNQLGYDFRFNTAIVGGVGNVGNVCGSTKQLITRPYAIPAAGNLDDPATPNEDPTAQFQLNLPDPPWWDIAPPILLGGQQMPANANNQAFYVIKGTTLTLYAAAAALPAAPILTLQINADSAFQYCNGAWTRVD